MGVLATGWVALRLYSRKMKRMPLPVEDYCLLAALVKNTSAELQLVFIGGFGHHIATLLPATIERCLKLSLASQFLYAVALGLVKCSICLMLARIFFIRPFVIAARAAMVLAACWAVMTFMIGLLICRPLRMNWDPTTPGGKCGNENAAFAAVGVVDLITDTVILVLPIPMVLRLQIPQANKIGLICIFGAGLLTMVIGILRVVAVLNVDFTDFTYAARTAHIYSVVEIGVAIIVACSPTLRPLFDKIFRGITSLSSGNKSSAYGNRYASNRGGNSTTTDGFMKMGDEIALKSVDDRTGRVETRITASQAPSEISLGEERAVRGLGDEDKGGTGIHVRTVVNHLNV
ncbi:hypothetical protein K432DRAFT_318302 [Lepidopterella palustris CBS 459.81]|uniref:Rhodopsin domain-containing protein n=1 Tax=Lepidopterella palustris CBS 459.81 TaxID=1314670 RepID=A0A8E2EKD0_9PEZI|nr:hypothetical protein K432DRAFT_318302 [Lepidopterella palustris CBS 459.81]